MADPAAATHAATALLTEHLRWTPLSLIDDIINSINTLLYRAVTAVETGLLSAPPPSLGFRLPKSTSTSTSNPPPPSATPAAQARAEIETGAHALETLLESTVDRNFDKLEIVLLRSVLALPSSSDSTSSSLLPWLKLPHYEGLDFSSGGGGEKEGGEAETGPTTESIMAQRRKLLETRKAHALLTAERTKNERLLARLRALAGPAPGTAASGAEGEQPNPQPAPLAFLATHPAAKALSVSLQPPPLPAASSAAEGPVGGSVAANPLTTTAQFVTSQLAPLRVLLAELRPELAALRSSAPAPAAGVAEGPGGRQVERTLYVEGEVRRHLEDAGGDVDGGGEIGAGGRGRGEVRDLEGLVSAMGGKVEGAKEIEDEEMGDA